jgi:adenylosuccinate lyase
MTVLGIVAGTIGRINNEVFQLSRTEIHELHEHIAEDYVCSSTMPHKRNAEVSEFVVALCRVVMGNVALGLQSMISEHERDSRSWRTDWHTLPESSIMLAKALSATKTMLTGLEVHEDRIAENLDRLHGLLFSEALMFHLGKRVGKQTAHSLVGAAAMKAQTQGLSFRDLLFSSPEIMQHTTRRELEELMDYTKHLGQSAAQVEAAIRFVRELAASDEDLGGHGHDPGSVEETGEGLGRAGG